MKKLTPNLIVDDIEACLPFWSRFGFEKTIEVPLDDATPSPLGFVILKHGDIELMLQTRASLKKDVAAIGADTYRSVLYLEVADLGPIRKALGNWPRIVDERKTFYGATEIIVADPAGNRVFFAAHA